MSTKAGDKWYVLVANEDRVPGEDALAGESISARLVSGYINARDNADPGDVVLEVVVVRRMRAVPNGGVSLRESEF